MPRLCAQLCSLCGLALVVIQLCSGAQAGAKRTYPSSADPNYIGACLAAGDEHADIGDWVRYHLELGIGTIYIYDTGRMSMADKLAEEGFAQHPRVKHYYQSSSVAMHLEVYRVLKRRIPLQWKQLMAYSLCVANHKRSHRWLTFIDTDEFLAVTEQNKTLAEVMADYENYGGLAVNWRMFSSSGRVRTPALPVYEAYHACNAYDYPENIQIKTIANTEFVHFPLGAHYCNYTSGHFAVTTNYERVEAAMSNTISFDRLALRHYVSKSLAGFMHKTKRGSGMSNVKTMGFYHRIQEVAWVDCRKPAAWTRKRTP